MMLFVIGKGDEDIPPPLGGEKIPFDDREVAKILLDRLRRERDETL